MNRLTYKGQEYRIIHAINTKTTICSAIVALDIYASDIVNYLVKGFDLRKYYEIKPYKVDGYDYIYSTKEICTKSGKHVGYWDFPIPREFTLFPGRTTNLQENSRECNLMDFLYDQAISLLKIRYKPSDQSLYDCYSVIMKAFHEKDVEALDLLFHLDILKGRHNITKQLRELNTEEIAVTNFSQPRLQTVLKEALKNQNTYIEDIKVSDIYDMKSAPWLTPTGEVTNAGIEGICCYILHRLIAQNTQQNKCVPIKNFLRILSDRLLSTANRRRGQRFFINGKCAIEKITAHILKQVKHYKHEAQVYINPRAALQLLLDYAKAKRGIDMENIAPAKEEDIVHMQKALRESAGNENILQDNIVYDTDDYAQHYKKFLEENTN